MKKSIALCSVLITLVLVVTMFTACNDKTDADTTTTTTDQNDVVEQTGFTVKIGDKEAVVKKDGKDFQTLTYPKNSNVKFDKKYATKNNEFLDLNFDGKPDFYIAISSEDGVISYYCWLYNATKNEFDYSIILSELKNISVDSENQRILSSVKVDVENHVLSYRWDDGQLVLDNDYSDVNGGIPEEVTQVVQDNIIGTDKPSSKPAKPTNQSKPSKPVETTKKNNTGSNNDKTTKPSNKPSNITTTSPNVGGGVVLETGSLNSGGWY